MAQRTNSGWKLIKTLTPEETADARARMGLDEEGLRRSRTEGSDLDLEIVRLMRTNPDDDLTLDEAYALQARLEDEQQAAVKARRHAEAAALRERLDELAQKHGL